MSKRTKWITTTALLLALLIVLQAVTKAGGQFVTGSCVNLVLAISALVGGLWCGVTVALLSPFFAFLLGIGPKLFPLIPVIALGNVVFVLLLSLLKFRPVPMRYVAVLIAAVCKFAVLFLIISKTAFLSIMAVPIVQVGPISTMFSWPQLVTALIGGCIAVAIAPLLKKVRIGGKTA